MPGYGIDDVPHLDLDRDEQASLNSHDAEQATLMAEAVIQVAENDQIIGPISKLKAHQGTGFFHRAFSVLLFNTKGEMLLQQRSGEKVTFPNVWANACCSHPLHSPDEMDELDAMGVKRAAVRKLEQELGIDPASISTDDMTFMTKMRYAARMNEEWIEREVDHILVMCVDVEINPNPNEVSNVMWVDYDAMEAMLVEERGPKEAVAPWFRCIAARIMQPNWWVHFNDQKALAECSDELIHDMGDITHVVDEFIGAFSQCLLVVEMNPPIWLHNSSSNAAEPWCNRFFGPSFLYKHGFHGIIIYPHYVRNFVWVGIDFHVDAHNQNVINLALYPFFIHSCSIPHFCHEGHVIG